MATTTSTFKEKEVLHMAQIQISQAKSCVDDNIVRLHGLVDQKSVALRDCAKLYRESESRLSHMLGDKSVYTIKDALAWVSVVMTNHRTYLDGLQENGYHRAQVLGTNLTRTLRKALVQRTKAKSKEILSESDAGLLTSWSSGTYDAVFTVAQDGSGTHKTITEAIYALVAMANSLPARPIIHVKSGVYNEKVEIGVNLKNVMFVGDGMDQAIVIGNRNVIQGDSTIRSATFDVSGDGFWARDMTFENNAGPGGHQAVALRVSSDQSVFYKCSFKGYQDTIFLHLNRQFYRDCQIYGTIDFIFGDASVVFQNCEIFVRRPMDQQTNFITAQGRDDPNKPTGISIQNCQVKIASDFDTSKGSMKNYLGRPWKEYSRTLFLRTDLDAFIDWNGDFALLILYYGEYMNTGNGASTQYRVNWPGFHVLDNDDEATPFTVNQFLQGEQWIPATGVPFWSGI